MRRLMVIARLFDAEDKPLGSHAVKLEIFLADAAGWKEIGRTATTRTGNVKFNIDTAQFNLGRTAPALRLVEAGAPAPRVLSAGGMIRFTQRSETLVVDFGELERLDGSAFKRTAIDTSLARGADNVAGVPRKAGLSQTIVLNNLERDVRLRNAIARNLVPEGGLVINTDATVSGVGVGAIVTEDPSARPQAGGTLVGLSREIEALKAINLEKDAVITRKDQDLIARTAELSLAKAQVSEFESKLATAVTRAETAESKVTTLKAEKGTPAPVTGVVAGLGAKLSEANQQFQTKALPFRLGAVKIDVRGRLTPDGGGIIMGENIKDGSGFSAELIADAPRRGTDTPGVKVPDIAGLTDAAARRVLRSVGLGLKPAQQALPPGKGTAGQAITQHPAAGQTVPRGIEVLVVFGVATAAN